MIDRGLSVGHLGGTDTERYTRPPGRDTIAYCCIKWAEGSIVDIDIIAFGILLWLGVCVPQDMAISRWSCPSSPRLARFALHAEASQGAPR